MGLLDNTEAKPVGVQDRSKRGSASVSVKWSDYDRLVALAGTEDASISRVITGLLDLYEKVKAETDKAPKASKRSDS